MFPEKLDNAKYYLEDLPDYVIRRLKVIYRLFNGPDALKTLGGRWVYEGKPATIDQVRLILAMTAYTERDVKEITDNLIASKKVKLVLSKMGD